MELKVEIRPSKISGNGVFAMYDIKKGERLCYYDGHDLPIEKVKNDTDMDYAVNHSNNALIRFGDQKPKDKHGIAQIINDGACPVFNDCSMKEIRRSLNEYDEKSIRLCNCKMYNNSFWMYATKDIKKDEEILTNYGKKYWLMHFLVRSTNALLKLLLFNELSPIDTVDLDDGEACHLIEGVMMQDLKADYWQELLKQTRPKDLVLNLLIN